MRGKSERDEGSRDGRKDDDGKSVSDHLTFSQLYLITHLVLKYISRERDALPMHMSLHQREGTPNPIERNICESQMSRHVDEMQSVSCELSVAFHEENVWADFVEEGEGGFGFGEIVAVKALVMEEEGEREGSVNDSASGKDQRRDFSSPRNPSCAPYATKYWAPPHLYPHSSNPSKCRDHTSRHPHPTTAPSYDPVSAHSSRGNSSPWQ